MRPRPFAVDRTDRSCPRCFVELADGSVGVVDRKTLHHERTIRLGGSPRYIAFDAKGTLAVIPNEAGWVSVVH
ncbi:MAG TPA: hypothetical protein VFN38_02275 [Gemmatimonadaceae bacterium]|nr:hypothetical protein [Gemmatimonadaceae bacterium]